MVKIPARIAIYLSAGAVLLVLLDPPRGWESVLLILGFIVGAAYIDGWVERILVAQRSRLPSNVISLSAYRDNNFRRRSPFRLRSRLRSKPVFKTSDRLRAEELFQALLAETLNPRIIQRHSQDKDDSQMFEVRLPENQVDSSRLILERFRLKSAKIPS